MEAIVILIAMWGSVYIFPWYNFGKMWNRIATKRCNYYGKISIVHGHGCQVHPFGKFFWRYPHLSHNSDNFQSAYMYIFKGSKIKLPKNQPLRYQLQWIYLYNRWIKPVYSKSLICLFFNEMIKKNAGIICYWMNNQCLLFSSKLWNLININHLAGGKVVTHDSLDRHSGKPYNLTE